MRKLSKYIAESRGVFSKIDIDVKLKLDGIQRRYARNVNIVNVISNATSMSGAEFNKLTANEENTAELVVETMYFDLVISKEGLHIPEDRKDHLGYTVSEWVVHPWSDHNTASLTKLLKARCIEGGIIDSIKDYTNANSVELHRDSYLIFMTAEQEEAFYGGYFTNYKTMR